MFSDIVIIGAGPCGLAVAARLCERTPSALFTNDEHARYWKKHHNNKNSLEQERRRGKSSTDSGYGSEDENPSHPSIAVLDASSNEWLSTWKQRFRDLKISYLRSPLFFHPDPRDRNGLLAFAHEQNRVGDLREIPNVVGKELSKHEKKRQSSRKPRRKTPVHLRVDGRDQIDYFTPSSQLFLDHCDTIIDRYRLRNLVHETRVLDIRYDAQPQNLDHGLFTISTDTTQFESRIVIVAAGPSTEPMIPNLHQLPLPAQQNGSITHVFQPNGASLPPHLQHKLISTPHEPTNILVIGGGLTSAQLIDLLLTQHANSNLHIHLFLRHANLKQKPFDIDTPWVTKTRNHLMSTYWSADADDDRLTMLRNARNGGSVPPHFARILSKHVACGKLTIHTNTQLHLDDTCTWDNEIKSWTHLNVTSPTFTLPTPAIHHMIYCTGSTPSFQCIPFLHSLQHSHPIDTIGDLPILTDDLKYNDDIPLFFMGALAALRLGPGAANLAGARQGAERVAWGVDGTLGRFSSDGGGRSGVVSRKDGNRENGRNDGDGDGDVDGLSLGDQQWEARSEFTGSFSNQFAALGVDGGAEG